MDDAAVVAETARRLDAVADSYTCTRQGCSCVEVGSRPWRQLAARFHDWPDAGYAVAPEHARLLRGDGWVVPDRAELRERIADAVGEVQLAPRWSGAEPGPGRYADSVMAVLADAGLIEREEERDGDDG